MTIEACREAYTLPAAKNIVLLLLSIPLLEYVSCIYYLLYFKKNQTKIQALINSGSEVNAMTLIYTARLRLKARSTNVNAQKIDSSTLKTFGIVLTSFQIEDKLRNIWFLQETFLVTITSMTLILGILFLNLNNINMFFSKRELTWRLYTTTKALLTTKWVQIIDYKKFAIAVLDPTKEVFIVYVAYLGMKMLIYPLKKLE